MWKPGQSGNPSGLSKAYRVELSSGAPLGGAERLVP
jgi:hypothetical protein